MNGPDSNGWMQKDFEALIRAGVAGNFLPEHWLQFATCESGLKRTAKNPYADARGLWQAMGTTQKNLGWLPGNPDFDAASGDFCQAPNDVQINWSLKYLEGWRKRFSFTGWNRAGDMYLCNFTPAYLPHKEQPDFTIFDSAKDPQTYWVNRGLDKLQGGQPITIMPPTKYAKDPPYVGKGKINVRDMELNAGGALSTSVFKQAVRSMNKLLQEGLNRRGERLDVDGVQGPQSMAALKRFWDSAGFAPEDRVVDAHTRRSLL